MLCNQFYYLEIAYLFVIDVSDYISFGLYKFTYFGVSLLLSFPDTVFDFSLFFTNQNVCGIKL